MKLSHWREKSKAGARADHQYASVNIFLFSHLPYLSVMSLTARRVAARVGVVAVVSGVDAPLVSAEVVPVWDTWVVGVERRPSGGD